ncbi:uncharacterized protein [Panulirus ornatus]|uniref:uncharacterized protein n=1 Tax=Panulirus ornatus TaxID=150431 RepID=UPI003A87BD53
MHQAADHHDVRGTQPLHGFARQHHQSGVDLRYMTPRESSDVPRPSWVSLSLDSEAGTCPLRASPTRQSIETGDLMTSRQTLPYHGQSRVPDSTSLETFKTVEDLRSMLPAEDVDELMHLRQLYRDTLSNLPLTEGSTTGEVERLWQLYGLFVERQSLFYTRLPWFKLLAASDCLRLLRQAVATSTHVTAAQFIDKQQYFWPRRNAPFVTTQSRVLASTIRQIVSHEHYVLLMTFYTHYAHLLADSNVALLTQVLSLFSETPGLSDPATVRLGREHYMGLVTRYLKALHGWQRGSEMLQVSPRRPDRSQAALRHTPVRATVSTGPATQPARRDAHPLCQLPENLFPREIRDDQSHQETTTKQRC